MDGTKRIPKAFDKSLLTLSLNRVDRSERTYTKNGNATKE